jgi:hypothetical protein
MDFFAYYGGECIEVFSRTTEASARRYVNKNYKDAWKIVIAPYGQLEQEVARQKSIEIAGWRVHKEHGYARPFVVVEAGGGIAIGKYGYRGRLQPVRYATREAAERAITLQVLP